MPDSNLSTSIAAVKTKITTDAPTATVDEILSLARAAKSVGLSEDAAVESAINSRVLTLSSGATTANMVKLANVIKQVRDATSSSGLTDISQLTDTTNLLSSGGGGSSVTVSDNAPSSPSDGDMWFNSLDLKLYIRYNDGATSQWIIAAPAGPAGADGAAGAAGAAGSVTSYPNLASFPSSGNTAGDIGFDTDFQTAHMWDGVAWQRMSMGPQIGPRITTTPPATHNLNNDGSTATTITMAAVDESGFPITYDWDAYSGSTVYNASSLPAQLTSVTESNGVFSLVGSSNSSNTGTFVFRSKASDGVLFTPAITTVSLGFGYNISNAIYDSLYLGVGPQGETNPSIIAFSSNGTKMFVCGTNGRKVLQYSLSTAFSLSGASYDSVQLDISGQAQYATDLKFNANGTKMYITDDNTNATYRYTLPTTFNLTSASYDNVSYNYSAAISPTRVSQIAFNNDGTKLYISSNEVITQCSLSTAYDPSTFTTDSKSFDAGSQVDEATNITFNDDGTKMLMGDMNDATVHQYSLGTAFDISTTSYDNVTHTFTEDTSVRGLTFADNGSKMFMAGTSNNRIYQYSVE